MRLWSALGWSDDISRGETSEQHIWLLNSFVLLIIRLGAYLGRYWYIASFLLGSQNEFPFL